MLKNVANLGLGVPGDCNNKPNILEFSDEPICVSSMKRPKLFSRQVRGLMRGDPTDVVVGHHIGGDGEQHQEGDEPEFPVAMRAFPIGDAVIYGFLFDFPLLLFFVVVLRHGLELSILFGRRTMAVRG